MIASHQPELPRIPSGKWFGIVMLALIALIMVLCNSCKGTKNITKNSTDTKTEIKESSVTTRTVTETAQDSVKSASDSLEFGLNFDDLKTNPFELENGNLRVDVNRDPVTNKINFKVKKKEEIIPIAVNRTIIEKIEDKKETKSDIKTKEKTKDKELTGGLNLNYLWWLLLLLVIPIWRYLSK